MTREQAIEVIRKEYACVDADCDIERNCGRCELHMPSKEPILKAYEMAIQALSQEPTEKPMCDRNICISNEYNGIGCDECVVNKEQEPCEDAISREQLLKVVTGDSFKSDFPRMSKALVEIIKALPPVSTTKNIVNHGTMNISL